MKTLVVCLVLCLPVAFALGFFFGESHYKRQQELEDEALLQKYESRMVKPPANVHYHFGN